MRWLFLMPCLRGFSGSKGWMTARRMWRMARMVWRKAPAKGRQEGRHAGRMHLARKTCGHRKRMPGTVAKRPKSGKNGVEKVWRLAHSKEEGFTPLDVNPCAAYCRREDSNLHTLNGYQVLNLELLTPADPKVILEKRCKLLKIMRLQRKFSMLAL